MQMSFWSDIAPFIGAIGGGLIGGPFGAAIGAGLGSGISGSSDASDARGQQQQQFEQNIALQREFAQKGIQWRVEDARAAGLHPLAALGAGGASFSPVSSSIDTGGNHFGAAGQEVARAFGASADKDQKNDALSALTLERAGLENELLRAQIAKTRAQMGPGLPGRGGGPLAQGAGQGDARVVEEPLEKTVPAFGARHSEPGAVTDVGFARTAHGLVPVPAKHVKERIEDSFIPETAWAIRNSLLPNIGSQSSKPPLEVLRREYGSSVQDAYWSWRDQSWKPVHSGAGGRRYREASKTQYRSRALREALR